MADNYYRQKLEQGGRLTLWWCSSNKCWQKRRRGTLHQFRGYRNTRAGYTKALTEYNALCGSLKDKLALESVGLDFKSIRGALDAETQLVNERLDAPTNGFDRFDEPEPLANEINIHFPDGNVLTLKPPFSFRYETNGTILITRNVAQE